MRNTVELIDFIYKYPFPHIIAGDFNAEPESDEIQHLLGKRALGEFIFHLILIRFYFKLCVYV
jgi:hypothetical protein